ncbi:VQ motif-containing protein 25 [Coffea arabica]|uniref:VQ motif-containing protein 25 n=1 Tax=Coffea arabica TaxID=13443 RepID=A0A6P6T144_COFAR
MYIMEGMTNRQNCVANTSVTGAALGLHKNSQMISKVKPKIRIIHIFAPEIIKTDVANFRELVQRLTGKPTENKNGSCTKKKLPRIVPSNKIEASRNTSCSTLPQHHMIHRPLAKKMELRSGFHCASFRERIKGEEEIWRGANSGGGFLGGFAELEGFMEQLNHEFPLLPAMPMEASHMDAYGQSQLA